MLSYGKCSEREVEPVVFRLLIQIGGSDALNFRFGGKRGVRSAECGKCRVWKMRGVENEECGKCGVWKMRRKFQFSVSLCHSNVDKQCVNNKKIKNKKTRCIIAFKDAQGWDGSRCC